MPQLDATRPYDRALVDALHASADRASGELALLFREAAVVIDEYQSGGRPVTLHPSTGYRVLPTGLVQLLETPACGAAFGPALEPITC